MKSKIHFFTEPTKITQTSTDGYGPISNTQFRTTSHFTLSTDAKAFAAFSGLVWVFDNDTHPDLVNVVLVPLLFNKVELRPGLLCMIYRGLKRSDFMSLNGSNYEILQTGFTTNFLSNVKTKFKGTTFDNDVIGYSPTSLNGHSTVTPSDTPLFNILQQRTSIAFAKKGDVIGNFAQTTGAGIDIVLDERKHYIGLNLVRAHDHTINIGSFSSSDLPGNESYNKLKIREGIKNFIDPCAYYNLFRELGIGYDGDGNPSTFNFTQYYTDVASKFSTSNVVYLDIRNNNDYSLNYYKDNQDSSNNNFLCSVDSFSSSGFSNYTNYWPITILSLSSFDTGSTNTKNYNTIDLAFFCDYNPEPLVYYDLAFRNYDKTNNSSADTISDFNFAIDADKFEDMQPVTAGISKECKVLVPNVTVAGTKAPIASLIKLYCLRTKEPSVPLPDTVVPFDSSFDNIFGDITADAAGGFSFPLTSSTNTALWKIVGAKKFMPISHDNPIARMVQTGVGLSNNDVSFLALDVDKNEYSFDSQINSVRLSQSQISSGETSQYTQFKTAFENIYKQKFGKITTGHGDVVTTLEQNPEPASALDNDAFFSINLTKDQIAYIQSIINSQFDVDKHQVCLAFDQFNIIEDSSSVFKYGKGRVILSGMDSAGVYKKLTTINTSNSNLLYTTVNKKILSTSDSNTTSGINYDTIQTNANAYIHVVDYIDLIKKVEEAFPAPSETTVKIVSRIRQHYYGIYDSQKYRPDLQTALEIALPNANGASGLYDMTIAEDWAYYNNVIDGETFKKLTSQADENTIGDNPSPYLKHPYGTPLFIDVGHLLYGLDGLLSNFKSTHAFFNQFQIFRSNDLTGYIADVFTPAAEARIYKNGYADAKIISKNVVYPIISGTPTTVDYDRLYEISAPEADLYSDVDPFGLFNAYNYLSLNSLPNKLSDVFSYYYDETFNPATWNWGTNHENIPPNYKFRWLNFCIKYDCTNPGAAAGSLDAEITQYQGFVELNASTHLYEWQPSSNPTHISVEILRKRGEAFAHFWYQKFFTETFLIQGAFSFNKFLEKNDGGLLVRFERSGQLSLKGALSTYLGSGTDDTELTYMMNKFLTWVEGKFAAEKSSRGY